MRIAVAIELSEEERRKLKRLSSSRSISVGLYRRVRIVLMADEGKTNQEISSELGVSQPTVGLWRNRFAEEGINVSPHFSQTSLNQV